MSRTEGAPVRLAIVTTHPIQYYAPWFRWIAENSELQIKAFYLWDFGVARRQDPGFEQAITWDIPLLDGYESEFVPNVSRNPGTGHFWGIRNSGLAARISQFKPTAALLIGYRYASMMRLIFAPTSQRRFPLIFRGDSHRLGAKSEHINKGNLQAKERARRWAITQIYKRFEAFLYVGKANRDYFCLHGVPGEKLFFAPHAVDNERFFAASGDAREAAAAWRAGIGISPTALVVLYAGKFEETKRPLDLLRAFKALRATNAALLFVGAGPLEASLREEAAGRHNVFFAPFQNQSEMPRTYAAGDVFVLPSWGESWGLAINEAMCMAKPVIVSDRVGCGPDLVRSGENGLIFEAGSVSALAESLSDALRDRERLVQWGQTARHTVERYSYAAATRGVEDAVAAISGRRSHDRLSLRATRRRV